MKNEYDDYSALKQAQYELDLILKESNTPEQVAVNSQIMDVMRTFSEGGLTENVAMYQLAVLNRLIRHLPLSALTGEDDEWMDASDFAGEPLLQNKRCPQIFKYPNTGKAYNVTAKQFSDDNGATWYTCSDSREEITFPYDVPDAPQRIIIQMQGCSGCGTGELGKPGAIGEDDSDGLEEFEEEYSIGN